MCRSLVLLLSLSKIPVNPLRGIPENVLKGLKEHRPAFQGWVWSFVILFSGALPSFSQPLPGLESLAQKPAYTSHRVSSYDRSGGNNDRLNIKPGETKVLAEIEGPGAITHLWNTVSAERYYAKMLVLRIYWDGQATPSVEVPLGDFFGVGHGVDRAFQSAAVAVSSEGRARNCYWFMPFQKSAKVTVTHEGFDEVRAFYYYVDYRKYPSLPDGSLYFHAHYRQAVPNPQVDLGGSNLDGKANYVVLNTEGSGQYVGTVLSAQLNQPGWFGEGDDMFYIDGDVQPTMTGTGTEDYFNDAWGFREFDFPYHGVSLWEGYDPGARLTAYKWHVADPVAFTKSLRVTIEHGHANDRHDDWYSVAYWYQTLPPPAPPAMANAFERLPDEGQYYAERLFVSREIDVHLENDRAADAVQRVESYIAEQPGADRFGYWTLRKGILQKYAGQVDEAMASLQSAMEKSANTNDPKADEGDAEEIRELAASELKVLDERKEVEIYIVLDWQDTYELYIDGSKIGEDSGGELIRRHTTRLSRGEHAVAVKYQNRAGRGGFAMLLSHATGYLATDGEWKTSDKDEERGWNQRRFDDSGWKDAAVATKLGRDQWRAIREPYLFYTTIFQPPVIWTPGDTKNDQTVYMRRVFRF